MKNNSPEAGEQDDDEVNVSYPFPISKFDASMLNDKLDSQRRSKCVYPRCNTNEQQSP